MLASQAVKMCITPSAPPRDPVFSWACLWRQCSGCPVDCQNRLFSWGGGDWKSLWCVSAACGVCVCVCTCLHGYVYAPLCACVCACMWSATASVCVCFHACVQRGSNQKKCAQVNEVWNVNVGVGVSELCMWTGTHMSEDVRLSCLGDRGRSHHRRHAAKNSREGKSS